MPKCPRCQKEVYFGKGSLRPPQPPQPGHLSGTDAALAGLWVLRAPRLLAPILRTPSLRIPGVSQSCSALRWGAPRCPGWVILWTHPKGMPGCRPGVLPAQPHFLPRAARSPEPVRSPKAQLVKLAVLKAWAGEASTLLMANWQILPPGKCLGQWVAHTLFCVV